MTWFNLRRVPTPENRSALPLQKPGPHCSSENPSAVSELVTTESTRSSGFFIKKKPHFTALKKSMCIPKLL